MNRRVGRSAGRAATTALGAGAGLILLGWVLGAPVWVHHHEVTAVVRCDQVTRTVSSWAGEPDRPAMAQNELTSTRTNPEIDILLSIDEESLPVSDGARAVSIHVDAAAPWASGAGPGNPRTTTPVQVPECGAPATRVSDSADQGAADPLLPPAAGPTTEAVAGPTSPSDALREGVRLLPWLAGAALVGAIGRVLRNVVRRRSRGPVVTR